VCCCPKPEAPGRLVRVHNRGVHGLARVIVIIAPLLAAGGCAKAHAKALPGGPPLETPLPPPRVVSSPIESEPIVTAVPPIEAPGPRPAPTAPRPAPRAERTDPPPAQTAVQPPAPPPPAPPPVDEPARTLQTTANAPQVEQRTRGLLANAMRDLNRIDYRALGKDAQAQYDIAKRFTEQAEEALKSKNVLFAEQLADKAAGLAAQLLKR
jgi:type IV secretory pathway VirB10-like protein